MPDRTVPVDVLCVRATVIPEPNWCIGHDPDFAHFKNDLAHEGPEVPLTFHGHEVMTARITQAPYSAHPAPVVDIAELPSLDPRGTYEFAAALEEYAGRLRVLADQLLVILAGEDQ